MAVYSVDGTSWSIVQEKLEQMNINYFYWMKQKWKKIVMKGKTCNRIGFGRYLNSNDMKFQIDDVILVIFFFSFVPSYRSVSRLCVWMCLIECSQPTKNKHVEGTLLKRSTSKMNSRNENEKQSHIPNNIRRTMHRKIKIRTTITRKAPDWNTWWCCASSEWSF